MLPIAKIAPAMPPPTGIFARLICGAFSRTVHLLPTTTLSQLERFDINSRQRLAPGAVGFIEAPQRRAVQIKNAPQRAMLHQWDNQFRARAGIAYDMAGKCADIRNQCGFQTLTRRAAHAFSQRDSCASRLTLKRPQHQLATLEEIETNPIHFRQEVVKQRGRVRGIGYRILFAGEETGQLQLQFPIQLRLRGGDWNSP
jgi:hypothetical protein